ncbi:TcaA second domain-containing protein [Bacillus sp. FSL K6-3431]|uniref:TcaA second domain-containing protein n=1 Tax=Bacillus sp. FSL K6-3431 TaxID=2921500 RepID=UPI0030F78897
MNCTKCKTSLNPNAVFCQNCGVAVEAPPAKKRAKPPFLKKLVIILSACVTVILLGIVLYQIGLNAYSPEKTVATFREAINKNDVDTITSLLKSNSSTWDFKEDDADLLLTYFKDHPNDKDKLFNNLNHQAEQYKENSKYIELGEKHFANISLQRAGKKWLFFHNYSLLITPANISVAVDQDDAKIFIGEMEVEANTIKNDYHSYGPFSIGSYEIKAELLGKYIDAEETKEVDLFNLEDSEVEENLSINASKVEAFTTYNDTTLYMNGNKTDAKIGTKPEELGMVPIDGSITFTLEKEFPWGVATSDDFLVEQRNIDMSNFVVLSPEEREEIMIMLNKNWEQHIEALQTSDTSNLTLVPKVYKDAVKKQTKNLHGKNKEYIATFIKARYDIDTLKTPIYNEELNRYELKVEAEYTLNEPQLHAYALLRQGDDATTTYYMTLYYDEGDSEWKIENYTTGSFFLSSLHEIKSYDIVSKD